MLTEALRLSGEVSAVKVPQPSRLTLISEGLQGRVRRRRRWEGARAAGRLKQEGSEEGERPHPTKNKRFVMIDTDSSGLIGPDAAQGGGGGDRQDLWLASRCQLRRCSEPPRSA